MRAAVLVVLVAVAGCAPPGELTIVAPDDHTAVDGEPFEIAFEVGEHDDDLRVRALWGGSLIGEVDVLAGTTAAVVLAYPEIADTGVLVIDVEASRISGDGRFYGHDRVTIDWTAPPR